MYRQMSISKAWDWSANHNSTWLEPCEESYYLADRWQKRGYVKLLDAGCGLGRHSVLFSQRGFGVSAFDLSSEGTEHLCEWSKREDLAVDVQVADMLSLPYGDDSFDCLFAYHVISHTDSIGIRTIMKELSRVTKPHGELFLTFCSKESWFYRESGFPQIDGNTIRKISDGPEKDVPHYYANAALNRSPSTCTPNFPPRASA